MLIGIVDSEELSFEKRVDELIRTPMLIAAIRAVEHVRQRRQRNQLINLVRSRIQQIAENSGSSFRDIARSMLQTAETLILGAPVIEPLAEQTKREILEGTSNRLPAVVQRAIKSCSDFVRGFWWQG